MTEEPRKPSVWSLDCCFQAEDLGNSEEMRASEGLCNSLPRTLSIIIAGSAKLRPAKGRINFRINAQIMCLHTRTRAIEINLRYSDLSHFGVRSGQCFGNFYLKEPTNQQDRIVREIIQRRRNTLRPGLSIRNMDTTLRSSRRQDMQDIASHDRARLGPRAT